MLEHGHEWREKGRRTGSRIFLWKQLCFYWQNGYWFTRCPCLGCKNRIVLDHRSHLSLSSATVPTVATSNYSSWSQVSDTRPAHCTLIILRGGDRRCNLNMDFSLSDSIKYTETTLCCECNSVKHKIWLHFGKYSELPWYFVFQWSIEIALSTFLECTHCCNRYR